MYTRLWSSKCLVFIIPVILLILTFLTTSPESFVSAQGRVETNQEILERFFQATGIDTNALEIEDAVTIQLVDGTQLDRIKVVNPTTGEVTSTALVDGQVVNEQEIRAQAEAEWRAENGALTPDLVQKIALMGPQDTLDVAVWFFADIKPLPKPDHKPSPASDPSPTILSSDGTPSEDLDNKVMAGIRDNDQILADIEAFETQNAIQIQAQIEPIQARFLAYAQWNGLHIQYASPNVPLAYLSGVTLEQLEMLAQQLEIAWIYDASNPGGALLNIARPSQNANLLETLGGYTANGINVAVVEGQRVINTNPFLAIVSTRDTSFTASWHPTHVGGIIASTDNTNRGLAPDADVYSANGDDYATIAASAAAMDWGSTNAVILNNSFWFQNCGSSDALQSEDMHMDYIVRYHYDLAVVASGNFNDNNDCVSGGALYVSTPGKGYNSLTVGNFNDNNTLAWSDDSMWWTSSYNHDNSPNPRHKPEMAASGTNITSLSLTSPWNNTTATGTSMATPMVSAVAANMIEADPDLSNYPEALTAVLMATSLHNIEGNQDTSRLDGVGSLDASAALVSVERGHWASQGVSSSTSFPLDFYEYAYEGERVRYVIRWLSNPASDYTSDPQPPDLDLKVYRADGTYLQGNNWTLNSFEIVDFIAPTSETYRFEVSLDGSWSGGSTWLGRGWWRGVYRISPNTTYFDPKASPMGTQLAIYPSDWSPSNYWRVMSIKSTGSDHELELYSRSLVDDPSERQLLEGSYSGSAIDYIAIDGNHWPSSDQEQYLVYNFSGDGGYHTNWSNQGLLLHSPGIYGPYSFGSDEIVKAFDISFNGYSTYNFMIVPTSGAMDLGARLYKSSSGDSSSWKKSRNEYVASADSAPSGGIESFQVYNNGSFDYLGLVVYKNNSNSGQFYIYIDPQQVHIPLLIK